MFKGEELNTFTTVTLFSSYINNDGNLYIRRSVPIHKSSQNLVWVPPWIPKSSRLYTLYVNNLLTPISFLILHSYSNSFLNHAKTLHAECEPITSTIPFGGSGG
jgi:hypothetical protein